MWTYLVYNSIISISHVILDPVLQALKALILYLTMKIFEIIGSIFSSHLNSLRDFKRWTYYIFNIFLLLFNVVNVDDLEPHMY